MAKITTASDLNVGTELTINLGAKTFTLVATGNLDSKDGVTMQALYTKFIKLWDTSTYNNHPFPMQALDAKSGQWIFGYDGGEYNGWAPANDTTRSYIRDAGWSEYNSSGVLQRQFVGAVSLGSLNTGAQPYYQLTNGGSATNFGFTDEVNEPVKVYEVSSFDTRTYMKTYVREYNFTYDESDLTDTGETGTGAYKVNFLLSNAADDKIQANDATVAANTPYTGITVTWLTGNNFDTTNTSPYSVDDVVRDGAGRWYICTGAGTADSTDYANLGTMAGAGTATFSAYTGEREIDGTYYAFNIIVDGNAATKEQIYTKIQYLLRQNSDIDSGAGTRTGKITSALMAFEGNTLVTTTGVYIDDTLTIDSAFLTYTDVGGVRRSIPVINNQAVTVSGATAGSRIQIYDLTSNTELYNGTPTFPYTWTDPDPYVADREIRLRVSYVSGGTAAKKYISATIGTLTEEDFELSYLVAQEDDDVYITNAVDGSTVTGITINDTTDTFEVNKPGGELSLQELYAQALYFRFTETGIRGDRMATTGIDTANYSITGKTIKNVSSPSVPLKITGGWVTDADTDDPIDLIDTTGGTIFLAPPHVVAYASASDYSQIADAVWDEALSGHTTAGTAGKVIADTEANTDLTQAKVDQL